MLGSVEEGQTATKMRHVDVVIGCFRRWAQEENSASQTNSPEPIQLVSDKLL